MTDDEAIVELSRLDDELADLAAQVAARPDTRLAVASHARSLEERFRTILSGLSDAARSRIPFRTGDVFLDASYIQGDDRFMTLRTGRIVGAFRRGSTQGTTK